MRRHQREDILADLLPMITFFNLKTISMSSILERGNVHSQYVSSTPSGAKSLNNN